jgi:hypothetical protein
MIIAGPIVINGSRLPAGAYSVWAIPGEEEWTFRSADELRVSRNGGYEVREGEDNRSGWRQLGSDSVVVRVWDPHPRFGWRADSAARHGLEPGERKQLEAAA